MSRMWEWGGGEGVSIIGMAGGMAHGIGTDKKSESEKVAFEAQME